MGYIGQAPANKAITSADIEDGIVIAADIADDAITLAKMASGTDGNVISYDASGNPVAIATGSDGQVFTSAGAGQPPAFEAAPSSTADGYFGSLSAKDLGVGLHLKTADSSASVDAYADELVIEGSGHSGLTICSGTANQGSIYFADSGDTNLGRVVYDHNTNGLALWCNDIESLKIDSTGAVTKPLQPAFLGNSSSSQSLTNAANNTIVCGTEIYDRNADFDGTTFTAPITGIYTFSAQIVTDAGGGSDTRFSEARIKIFASNRQAHIYHGDLETNADDRMGMTISVSMDMDANDTAYLVGFYSRFGASGATDSIVDGTTMYTFFSGHLVC